MTINELKNLVTGFQDMEITQCSDEQVQLQKTLKDGRVMVATFTFFRNQFRDDNE